jgi:hypothetical protein
MSSWTDRSKKTETQKVDIDDLRKQLGLDTMRKYEASMDHREYGELMHSERGNKVSELDRLEEQLAVYAFAKRHGLETQIFTEPKVSKLSAELISFDIERNTNLSGVRNYGEPTTADGELTPEAKQAVNIKEGMIRKKLEAYVAGKDVGVGGPT